MESVYRGPYCPQSQFIWCVDRQTSLVWKMGALCLRPISIERRKTGCDAKTLPRTGVSAKRGVWIGVTTVPHVPSAMMYLENAMKFAWISAALVAFTSLNSAHAGLFHHYNSCCSAAPSCAAPAACAPSCAAPACAPAAPTCAAPACAPVCAAPAAPSCCAPVASCCNTGCNSCCKPRCRVRCPKLCMPKIRLHRSRCCGSTCGSTCGSSCAPSCAAPCAPSCAAPATACCN